MLVRLARPDEARVIAELDVESWRAAYRGLMPDQYLDGLSVDARTADIVGWIDAGRLPLVAERDGVVLGYATVGRDKDLDIGALHLLYVAASAWGTGAGRVLVTGARDTIAARGFDRAALWVLAGNARARAFYEGDGWTADGATNDDDYGGVTLTAMRYVTDVEPSR